MKKTRNQPVHGNFKWLQSLMKGALIVLSIVTLIIFFMVIVVF